MDEVVNYIRAMKHGLERLPEVPVSIELIREIHAQLLKGVRGSHLTPGEIRQAQNWIGPLETTIHEATFIPPPPEEIQGHLNALENFLRIDLELPLLIRIGLMHAQFETIHPFLDGNGRIGRLLIVFMLCGQGVLVKPVLYLSHYFKRHRQEYYDQLQSVRDRGTWEDWLTFFLRGVIEVSIEATKTARLILNLRETHRETIAEQFGGAAGNGHKVLEYLYEHPIISVSEARKLIGTAFPAANDLVSKFVDNGILEEITGRARNRRFMYRSYVNLFSDDIEEVPAQPDRTGTLA